MSPVIYVIDDDPAVRDSICLLLESYEFSAIPYASGTAFLKDARPDGNCALITDVNMPGISGLELIERLRREGNSMPAIAITADHLNDQILATAHKAGVTVLEKPFAHNELIGCIKRVLGPLANDFQVSPSEPRSSEIADQSAFRHFGVRGGSVLPR